MPKKVHVGSPTAMDVVATMAPTMRPVSIVSYVCTVEESKDDFDRQSWMIAVSLAVVAAFSNNLGVNLQKLAWMKRQRMPTTYQYRLYWLAGMVCIVFASVFDFVALAFAPQSVIAPMGSLTMVFNTCVAPRMLGESLHGKVVASTFIIVAGCILAVMSASHVNAICSVDALFALYLTMRFFAYALCFFAIVGVTMAFITRAERVKADYGVDTDAYRKVFRYHRVSYAFLSGLFGAQSVLFARSVGQLFVGSTRGGRIFLAYPASYLIVFCMVGCIVLQLYFLNLGLARFESVYNVPVFTGTFIVGVALGGGIFYGEFSQFAAWQAVCFPLGVVVCIIGVFMLTQSQGPSVMEDGTAAPLYDAQYDIVDGHHDASASANEVEHAALSSLSKGGSSDDDAKLLRAVRRQQQQNSDVEMT